MHRNKTCAKSPLKHKKIKKDIFFLLYCNFFFALWPKVTQNFRTRPKNYWTSPPSQEIPIVKPRGLLILYGIIREVQVYSAWVISPCSISGSIFCSGHPCPETFSPFCRLSFWLYCSRGVKRMPFFGGSKISPPQKMLLCLHNKMI